MEEKLFKYFFITYDNCEVVKIEPVPGVHVYKCVVAVIDFLRRYKIDGEFVLRFNDKDLLVSQKSLPEDVVKQYWQTKEHVL